MSAIPLAADRNPRSEPPATITDDQLARQLAARPVLFSEIKNAADRAYSVARAIRGIEVDVDRSWKGFELQGLNADRAAPMQNNLGSCRAYLAASAFFNDLASLNLPHPNPLVIYDRPLEVGQIADTPEARALLKSRPSTKAWLAARDQGLADLEARLQAGQDAAAHDAPQNFLKNLRGRGVELQLTHAGNLIVPAGTDMTMLLPCELESVKHWKPQLVAILQAEADAVKATRSAEPVVLA